MSDSRVPVAGNVVKERYRTSRSVEVAVVLLDRADSPLAVLELPVVLKARAW